jgi:hypothetical protein
MRRLSLTLSLLLLAATVGFARGRAAAKTYSGEIMDSQCAAMAGHEEGYKMTGTSTAKDCTVACVKAGGQYVLFDAAKKTTFKLDNQEKPRSFAGQSVKVIGTYDAATKTIHVEKIEAAK